MHLIGCSILHCFAWRLKPVKINRAVKGKACQNTLKTADLRAQKGKKNQALQTHQVQVLNVNNQRLSGIRRKKNPLWAAPFSWKEEGSYVCFAWLKGKKLGLLLGAAVTCSPPTVIIPTSTELPLTSQCITASHILSVSLLSTGVAL